MGYVYLEVTPGNPLGIYNSFSLFGVIVENNYCIPSLYLNINHFPSGTFHDLWKQTEIIKQMNI